MYCTELIVKLTPYNNTNFVVSDKFTKGQTCAQTSYISHLKNILLISSYFTRANRRKVRLPPNTRPSIWLHLRSIRSKWHLLSGAFFCVYQSQLAPASHAMQGSGSSWHVVERSADERVARNDVTRPRPHIILICWSLKPLETVVDLARAPRRNARCAEIRGESSVKRSGEGDFPFVGQSQERRLARLCVRISREPDANRLHAAANFSGSRKLRERKEAREGRGTLCV